MNRNTASTKKSKKKHKDRGVNYIKFKASMILLFHDIDMFGDITRVRENEHGVFQ